MWIIYFRTIIVTVLAYFVFMRKCMFRIHGKMHVFGNRVKDSLANDTSPGHVMANVENILIHLHYFIT